MKKHTITKFTKSWLISQEACKDGLEFAWKYNFNLSLIWLNCERGDWMWWLLVHLKVVSKKLSATFAKNCAENAQKYAADVANVHACISAVFIPAVNSYAATAASSRSSLSATTAAADAAATAATYIAASFSFERKRQADFLRTLITLE